MEFTSNEAFEPGNVGRAGPSGAEQSGTPLDKKRKFLMAHTVVRKPPWPISEHCTTVQ